jgi:hypothetical protein
MKRRRYRQTYNGEKFVLRDRELRSMCCDCGLIHLYKFRVERHGVRTVLARRVWRLNRATAAARRGKKLRGLKLPRQ